MTDEKQQIDPIVPAEEKAIPQDSSPKADVSPGKPQSLRETILAAKKEAESKSEQQEPAKEPEKSEKPAAEPPEKEVKKPEKSPPADEADKPKGAKDSGDREEGNKGQEKSTLKPPTSWSKSSRAEWDALPESIQQTILKREEDTARGVDELKKRHQDDVSAWRTRHSDVEEAIRPYEDAIQNSGRTKGQVVKDLLDWNMALVGPHKLQAFQALARSFGVDVNQIAGVTVAHSAPDASQADFYAPVQAPVVDRSWEPAIRNVAQRLEEFERNTAAQRQAAAEQVVHNWAKDKTHFERVRVLMAQLVDNDAKMGGVRFLKNGQIDMDAAYDAAVWADPEVRADLLREQREQHEAAVKTAAEKAKAEADARLMAEKTRADAEKARRAAVSLRPSAPISGVNGAAPGSVLSRESVRDSIKRALSGM